MSRSVSKESDTERRLSGGEFCLARRSDFWAGSFLHLALPYPIRSGPLAPLAARNLANPAGSASAAQGWLAAPAMCSSSRRPLKRNSEQRSRIIGARRDASETRPAALVKVPWPQASWPGDADCEALQAPPSWPGDKPTRAVSRDAAAERSRRRRSPLASSGAPRGPTHRRRPSQAGAPRGRRRPDARGA